MSKWLIGAGTMVLLLGGVACAPPPKVVTKITSARDQMKFLVVQGHRQSVVKCQVGPDGALSGCKQMTVILQDED